jgi:hypothetical protein
LDAQGEDPQLTALKLQLQIAKLTLEQAKLNSGAAALGSSSDVSARFENFGGLRLRLPVMSADADIFVFLNSFEKCMLMHSVPKAQWYRFLPGLLNEKATSMFITQTIDGCQNYDVTRKFLCATFQSSPEVYKSRLLSLRRTGSDSYQLFLRKLSEVHVYYLQSKQICDFESLFRDQVLVYFLDSLPPLVKQFVLARQPASPEEAAKLADLCFTVNQNATGSARGQTNRIALKQPFRPKQPDQTATKNQDLTAQSVENGSKTGATGGKFPDDKKDAGKLVKGACWICKDPSHTRHMCPLKKCANTQSVASVKTADEKAGNVFIIPMYVETREGRSFTAVRYRDTGADLSICTSQVG